MTPCMLCNQNRDRLLLLLFLLVDHANNHMILYDNTKVDLVVVAVIGLPLPRDGGTARTTIQVYAINLIEIRLGERWQPILNQS